MRERILSSLLCALAGAMGLFLVGLVFAISSSEGDKNWATLSMYIGGVSALLVCIALLLASLIGKVTKRRPAARQLPERSPAPVRTVVRTKRTGQEGVRRAPPVSAPLHEVNHTLESDAALFLLDERDLDAETDGQADFEPSRPAPALRELTRRVVGAPTEGNDSHSESFLPVEGTNRKGRLCWICGKEHGPEIVHGTTWASACNAVPVEWLLTAQDP